MYSLTVRGSGSRARKLTSCQTFNKTLCWSCRAAKKNTDRNRFYISVKTQVETTLCCKGRSLHRCSDSSHTATASVTSLESCHFTDSPEVEAIESIAARGSRWRRGLLFLLPEWFCEWNGSFVIRAVHSSVFVLQDNDEEISSQSISTASTKRRVPPAEREE